MFKFHSLLLKHKPLAFFALMLFIGVFGFTASRITLEEDISNLIPSGNRQDVLKKVLEHTEFSDKIIVSISSLSNDPNPNELTQYAQQFLDSINLNLPEYIKAVQGKVPEEGIRELYNFVYQNLPLFLNEADYATIDEGLEENRIKNKLQDNYKNLISPTGLVTKEFIFKDPLSLTGLGLQKLQELQVGDNFELYNNFLMSRDQKHVFLFISPTFPASETNNNKNFIDKLEQIKGALNLEFDQVKGDFFGSVLYSIANANQIKKDIQLTLGIAGGILLLILIFYYRRIYVPILLFLPSLLGGLTALATLFLIKGTISAISLGIGAILLGISIDYSLHILTHYKNNNNLKKLFAEVTTPVLMSSITTAIAFLCLLFLNSEALNDLGIFAAISVVVASIFALILIPILYKAPQDGKLEKATFLDKIAAVDYHKNYILVAGMLLIFIIGCFYFTNVRFNQDLSSLNFEPADIKQKEANIQQIAGRAANSMVLVSYGNTIDEALENNNQLYQDLKVLEDKGEINSYSSIGGVVLSTSTQLSRIERWQEFWDPEKRLRLSQNLIEQSATFGFKPQSFQTFYELIEKDFEPIFLEDYKNTTTLYLEDFITNANDFATVTTSVNVPQDRAEALLKEIEDRENVVVVDRQQLNEGFLGNLKNEFNRLIGFSVVAVFIVLLMFYRSLTLSILTLLPIGITWIITLGIMAIFSIEFNILNIIISTFIFGLGLDYSIFVTNAFIREYKTGLKVIKTYRTSILLSVITTLLGIGALMFARHPALKSVSMVSIIGVLVALLVAFIIQSFIFQALFLDRKAGGKASFSFQHFIAVSKYTQIREKLYNRKEIYANYRYHKNFSTIRNTFELEKERFLKVAQYLDVDDVILQYRSGKGLLAIFLHYKLPSCRITGIETNKEDLHVARNSFAATSKALEFREQLPESTKEFNVIVLTDAPDSWIEAEIKKMITTSAKKVFILDAEYSYRWIIDLNFEIKYRQNGVVLLQKVE